MPKLPESLEPLADYLEPQFGNIYELELMWTDGLRAAVKQYLLHVAPAHLVDAAFGRVGSNRDKWTEEVISSYEPWEVAFAIHRALVISMSLDALIGHLDSWTSEDERMDAVDWLEGRASREQLGRMAVEVHKPNLAQAKYTSDIEEGLVKFLDPPALLSTWHVVVDPVPSDLTDAEWKLIEPFIPTGGAYAHDRRHLAWSRDAINGMLYWSSESCSWSRVPDRYGSWQSIYQRRARYEANGVFAQMLKGLKDKPEAERLIEWLRKA